MTRRGWLGLVVVVTAGAGLAAPTAALAQSSGIYTCVDGTGKRLTSDRPIPECNAREQRVLNRDGSTRSVVQPPMTADEAAAAEARAQQEALAKAARQDAMRRDRNLLQRFPNEAAHNGAREAALDSLRKSLKLSEQRLQALTKERKPLLDEAEFYTGVKRPLPPLLKQHLDGNQAAADAQLTVIATQEAEVVRINALYDVELERLRKLWGGATPGSLGPLPKPAGPASSGAPGGSSAASAAKAG